MKNGPKGKKTQIFFHAHNPYTKNPTNQKKKSVAKLNWLVWIFFAYTKFKKSRKTKKYHIFISYKRNYIQKVVKLKVYF